MYGSISLHILIGKKKKDHVGLGWEEIGLGLQFQMEKKWLDLLKKYMFIPQIISTSYT